MRFCKSLDFNILGVIVYDSYVRNCWWTRHPVTGFVHRADDAELPKEGQCQAAT